MIYSDRNFRDLYGKSQRFSVSINSSSMANVYTNRTTTQLESTRFIEVFESQSTLNAELLLQLSQN